VKRTSSPRRGKALDSSAPRSVSKRRPTGPAPRSTAWMSLDEVAHLAGMGCFEYDPESAQIRVSQIIGRMLRLPSPLRLSDMLDVVDIEGRRTLRTAWCQARTGMHARVRIGADIMGSRRWFQVDLAPLIRGHDGSRTLKGSIVDISEHVISERQWMARMDDAEQNAGSAGRMLSGLSHEIRTPLGSILGLARIGEQDSAGRSNQALFSRIEKSGKYLLEVVDKMLDYSALQADRMDLERTTVRTADVIDRAIELVAERAEAKHLPVLVDEAPGLPDTFEGDPLRITQILVNLLGNAIKFTDRGHVSLRIRLTGATLRFDVSDTGMGLDPDQISRLFQPFTQADASTARRFGGSGLGLAISQQLAAAMDGHIDVESALDEGSCFSLSLPLNQAKWLHAHPDRSGTVVRLAGLSEPEASHMAGQLRQQGCAVEQTRADDAYVLPLPTCLVTPRAQADRYPCPPGLSIHTVITLAHGQMPPDPDDVNAVRFIEAPLRVRHLMALMDTMQLTRRPGRIHESKILVADDCPINRLIVEDILRRAGVPTIKMFESGADAICEVVTREPNYFAAAILDIQMPGMDGIETATQLRNIAPHLPVIALSGESDPVIKARAMDAGIVAFLTKPVADDTLLSALTGELDQVISERGANNMEPARSGESQVFDLQRMQRRFQHHDALIRKLLSTFRTRHRQTPFRLQRAIAEGDWKTVGQIAHTLKGMAGHLQAFELYLAAQKVSNAVRHQGLAAHRYIDNMLAALERLIRTLDELGSI